jgi:hypothetical protein
MHTPAPTLSCSDESGPARPITLVVYAPFADDATLSTYPDSTTTEVSEHPLYAALQAVADQGVQVCALIDRAADNTSLVWADAGGTLQIEQPRWKHDMGSPRTLANLLQQANRRFRGSEIVLCLEGHGAGFLPEIDASRITPGASGQTTTSGGGSPRRYSWVVDGEGSQTPEAEDGLPYLPMTESTLPGHLLPGGHYPIATWGLGWALEQGMSDRPSGDRRVAVLHFNNCFNFCVEVLHTVAPHTHYAVGYANYNFFTAGRSYPGVFAEVAKRNVVTAEQLAVSLAQANAQELAKLPVPHPTLGGAIKLSRMAAVAVALDRLSLALIDSLPAQIGRITSAVVAAQRYDTHKPFSLVEPDSLTDLRSLAARLQAAQVSNAVTTATADLRGALSQVKVYGASGNPYMAPHINWDFSSPDLAMNIFLPDPGRKGVFDWRAPYYLSKRAGDPEAQTEVIPLLLDTHWVDFIRKYHAATAMKHLLVPRIPQLPVAVYSRKFAA